MLYMCWRHGGRLEWLREEHESEMRLLVIKLCLELVEGCVPWMALGRWFSLRSCHMLRRELLEVRNYLRVHPITSPLRLPGTQ